MCVFSGWFENAFKTRNPNTTVSHRSKCLCTQSGSLSFKSLSSRIAPFSESIIIILSLGQDESFDPYVNVCFSNYSLVFTETFFRAEAQPPSSVLVRIPPSKGFNVWLRLQVKNAVCTEVIPRNMAFV